MPEPCRKHPYPNQASARLALASILTKRTAKSPKRPVRVYPCDLCDDWHLTSKKVNGKVPPWGKDPEWSRPKPQIVPTSEPQPRVRP